MPKIRTFVAIEIPDDLKQSIGEVQADLKKFRERVSWVKPANVHLTLKFLGDVEESQVDEIGLGIAAAAKDIAPFTFSLKDVGAFPNVRRPRVLWVGAAESTGSLVRLAQRIDAEVAKLGFPEEQRRFNAHLTIGRIKSRPSEKFVKKIDGYGYSGGDVRVEKIVLMRSDLHPTGAVYSPLRHIALKSV